MTLFSRHTHTHTHKQLLNRNPKHRLGSQHDTEDLKRHGFFKSIDWTLLESRQIVPSFKPYIDSDDSVVNFDVEFTQLDINQELPMSMRLFDEEDRSADWVTQASSYVNPTPIHLKQPTTTSSGTKPVPMPKEVVNQSKGEDTLQDHFRGFVFVFIIVLGIGGPGRRGQEQGAKNQKRAKLLCFWDIV